MTSTSDEHDPRVAADATATAPRVEISARVRALLADDRRLGGWFAGRGQPAAGVDGLLLPTTSAGYDLSVALGLARHGIRVVGEVAAAILCRPDDAARARGVEYALDVARRAVALAEEEDRAIVWWPSGGSGRGPGDGSHGGDGDGGDGGGDAIERVRIYDTQPPTYELCVRGQTMRVGPEILASPQRFAVAVLAHYHRLPAILPDRARWARWVTHLLARAERIPMPPEASRDESIRIAIHEAVDGLATARTADDLRRGLVVRRGQHEFVRLDAVRTRLRDDYADVPRHELGVLLRDAGYRHWTLRIDGEVIHAWRGPARPAGGAESNDDRGGDGDDMGETTDGEEDDGGAV